jgi:hypothetical protein
MLLKSADDKSSRVRLLEQLAGAHDLAANQRDWARKQLAQLRKGIEGERSAAHYLDNYIGHSKNSVLIHDLRISLNNEIAQIDHLLMNRAGMIMLFETKHFGGNISINEHGEFAVSYGSSPPFGIPSPLEQSRRHENVLSRLLPTIGIEPRIGSGFTFHHLVLINPRSTITRPHSNKVDTSHVMKADMFPDWHKKWIDSDLGAFEVVRHLGNLRSAETLQAWGERLVQQHQPADLSALPSFIEHPPSQTYLFSPLSQQSVL